MSCEEYTLSISRLLEIHDDTASLYIKDTGIIMTNIQRLKSLMSISKAAQYIWCAQRRGNLQSLLHIYKIYTFGTHSIFIQKNLLQGKKTKKIRTQIKNTVDTPMDMKRGLVVLNRSKSLALSLLF